MWVLFKKRFDWKPMRAVALVYHPGLKVSVTRRCGEAAVSAGAAVPVETPRRGERS